MRRVCICVILLCIGTPLFAQQGWKVFVTTISGSQPVGASFLNEDYGFVQTASNGTFRTTDGGNTWVAVPNSSRYINMLSYQFYFYTPAIIYSEGYYESDDSGMTWHALKLGAPSGLLYRKDNTLFDATGYISTDLGNNWAHVNIFDHGEQITGDLGQGIAIWGGSDLAEDSSLYSTDGGKSWKRGGIGVEADFGYAIPFQQTYFRAGGDGNDAIQRSVDGGATWQTVYGFFPYRYLSDGVIGQGCVIYAQTSSATRLPKGLLRSVDAGNTWTSIGGPIAGDDIPISGIAKRGSVLFALRAFVGGTDTLWKYTDPTTPRPLQSDMTLRKFFPDTVTISQCDSVDLALELGFSACDYIRMQNVKIDGLNASDYQAVFHQDRIIATGQPDTSALHISKLNPGSYSLFVHLRLNSSDWTGFDTLLPLTLIVNATPPEFLLQDTVPIDFGTAVLCRAGANDTLEISNTSCVMLDVRSVRFESDAATQNDFTLSTSGGFQLNNTSQPRKISLIFAPLTSGVKSGNLIIETSAGTDTIPVHALVLPDEPLVVHAADTLTAPLCDSAEGFITFSNQSCRQIALDSLSVPPPYSLLPVALPAFLAPGESVKLRFRFLASQRGFSTVQATGHFRFFEPNATLAFDSVITLSAMCIHGASDFIFSSSSLVFDTLHLCDSAIKYVALYSTGCDSLDLRDILLSGDSSFRISENGKRNLASGDSIIIAVMLDPTTKGNKAAQIVVSLPDGTTRVISLSAVVLRALRTLTCDRQGTLDFGTHLTCENSDTLITVVNPGCDTVRVSGVGFNGTGFGTNASFPILIPPGESRPIDVQSLLDTAGRKPSNTSVMDILSDADNMISPLTLIHSYIYPYPVHIWLDGEKLPVKDSGVWKVKVKAIPSEILSVNQIDFTINYNTDLLEYLPGKSSVSSVDGKSFHLSGSIIPDIDSSIGEISFLVYLTKDTTTNVVISDMALNAGDPKFMGCTVFPLSTGTEFTYLNQCGDRFLRTFMKGQPLQLSIRPNPAHDEIELELESAVKQDANIEIFDALGVKVFSEMRSVSTGANTIHLDTKSIPAGMYVLRIGGASQSFLKVR